MIHMCIWRDLCVRIHVAYIDMHVCICIQANPAPEQRRVNNSV